MTSTVSLSSPFALDVAQGLSDKQQKRLAPRYFYDDLGSALFEAITVLPEYGLTRADEELLRQHAPDIAAITGPLSLIAELGSGSGRKTTHILRAFCSPDAELVYRPIDVSPAALACCASALSAFANVQILLGDWIDGLGQALSMRRNGDPSLVLFLGSSIGNMDRQEIGEFLQRLRTQLHPGDYFLLGADLVKDIDVMLTAYDDPTGVTAAFNLNLLGRMNRELGADFDLRSFAHEVRWNQEHRRIEMHLLSGRDQTVFLAALDSHITFRAGETIWTESSHKFTLQELETFASQSGFAPVTAWTDHGWPFAEVLWRAL